MIKIQNITKKYGTRTVLDDITMDIHKGEAVAILGKSGSGKSTLMNIVGVLDTCSAGSVSIAGVSPKKPTQREASLLRKNTIAYMFQNYALVDNLTVKSNLDLAMTCAGKKPLKEYEVLEKVDLKHSSNLKVFQLSGGEQQRVAFARLLLKPFEILIADEPTGSLDEENKEIIISLIEEIKNAGKTILIVTHDPRVARICDKSFVLENGKLKKVDPQE